MLSKPCGELYCHALAYCDMCGRLPFSTEYKLKVSGPQGAGAALCVLCIVHLPIYGGSHREGGKFPHQKKEWEKVKKKVEYATQIYFEIFIVLLII